MKSKAFGTIFISIFLLLISSTLTAAVNDPQVEIGNITRIKGQRVNQLIGYGIVLSLIHI